MHRLYNSWNEGEGVVYLGDFLTGGSQYRLSPSRDYIAVSLSSPPKLQLYKIANGEMEALGEFLFQGSIVFCFMFWYICYDKH